VQRGSAEAAMSRRRESRDRLAGSGGPGFKRPATSDGAWSILRAGAVTAVAEAGPGATLAGLAATVGLDLSHCERWITAQPLSGLDPAKAIAVRRVVRIPNTVVVVWAGELGGWGKRAVSFQSDLNYLRRRGFKVELLEAAATPAAELVQRLRQASVAGELHGFFIWSHGQPDSLRAGAGVPWNVSYAELLAALRYRLGLVILNACHGGFCGSDRDIPHREMWGWTDRRSPLPFPVPGPRYSKGLYNGSGTIAAGGGDLVSGTPGHRFFGHRDILNPVPLVRHEYRHVWQLLRPGEQGTTPGGRADLLGGCGRILLRVLTCALFDP
jgi:hypothetical protein